MAHLTNEEMRAVITQGGSVLHQGAVLARHDDLPSPIDLASSHEERAEILAEIDVKMAHLQNERLRLTAAPTYTPPSVREQPTLQSAQAGDGSLVPPPGTDVTPPGEESAPEGTGAAPTSDDSLEGTGAGGAQETGGSKKGRSG